MGRLANHEASTFQKPLGSSCAFEALAVSEKRENELEGNQCVIAGDQKLLHTRRLSSQAVDLAMYFEPIIYQECQMVKVADSSIKSGD